VKILLICHDKSDGYTDTSGYQHWGIGERFEMETFERYYNEKDNHNLFKRVAAEIADFLFKRTEPYRHRHNWCPEHATIEIVQVATEAETLPEGWDSEVYRNAHSIFEQKCDQRELKISQDKAAKLKKQQESKKNRELQQLRKLKQKYEDHNAQ